MVTTPGDTSVSPIFTILLFLKSARKLPVAPPTTLIASQLTFLISLRLLKYSVIEKGGRMIGTCCV